MEIPEKKWSNFRLADFHGEIDPSLANGEFSYSYPNFNEIESEARAVNMIMRLSLVTTITLGLFAPSEQAVGQEAEDFRKVAFDSSDGGRIQANLYGSGDHGVVLAHGAIFDKESWSKQSKQLAEEGFRVLAIDFRGYGKSTAGSQRNALHLDVLAAVRYLTEHGAKRVSVVGGSMGGGAAAQASVESKDGEIDALILLAHAPIRRPQNLKGRKLFIVSKGDRLLKSVQKQHSSAPDPKKLVVLDGQAHAQHIFRTDQAETLMKQIITWLKSDRLETKK